jgi:hypothetical protein
VAVLSAASIRLPALGGPCGLTAGLSGVLRGRLAWHHVPGDGLGRALLAALDLASDGK